MTIAEYLQETGMTQEEFGERIGVKQTQVSRWVTGRNSPGRMTRVAILALTAGAVDQWGDEEGGN